MSMDPWDPSRPPGTWTPPAPRPSRFALDRAVARDGVIAGAVAAAGALVVAYVVAAVLSAAVGDGTSSGGLPGVGHLGAWIDGLAFGAPLVLRAAGSASIVQVVVHSIAPDLARPGGYLAPVTFRSQQDPAYGPGGDEGCTDWQLTYQLTPGFKLLRPQGASHTAC